MMNGVSTCETGGSCPLRFVRDSLWSVTKVFGEGGSPLLPLFCAAQVLNSSVRESPQGHFSFAVGHERPWQWTGAQTIGVASFRPFRGLQPGHQMKPHPGTTQVILGYAHQIAGRTVSTKAVGLTSSPSSWDPWDHTSKSPGHQGRKSVARLVAEVQALASQEAWRLRPHMRNFLGQVSSPRAW